MVTLNTLIPKPERIIVNIFSTYPAKSRGISPDTLAELAKIRRYFARLSRIIVLLFNTLMTKHNVLLLLQKKAGKATIFLRDTKNNVYRGLLNSQPRIMQFSCSDWFTQSQLSAHIP